MNARLRASGQIVTFVSQAQQGQQGLACRGLVLGSQHAVKPLSFRLLMERLPIGATGSPGVVSGDCGQRFTCV